MSEYKEKIAFFDFCETLVNFQTADAYVDFVRLKTQSKRMKRIETIRHILYKFRIISVIDILFSKYPTNKKLKLFQLKGYERSLLNSLAEEYYIDKIKPNIIQPIIDRMLSLQTEGYKIVIVSGGYDIYLKFFAQDYGIDTVVSTSIKFDNYGTCLGIYNGCDCLSENKVKLLNKIYNKENINSIAFSDSRSDIPFLTWANEAYVISKGSHQQWQEKYKIHEIIW